MGVSLASFDMADRDPFTVGAMVRGYHAYRDIWEAALGDECHVKDKVMTR